MMSLECIKTLLLVQTILTTSNAHYMNQWAIEVSGIDFNLIQALKLYIQMDSNLQLPEVHFFKERKINAG